MKSKSSDPKMSKMAKQLKQQIAIVGIGCRYSGGVDGVEKFWDMLSQGLDCTTPPPSDRYDCNFYHSPGEKLPGKIYSERGGFLQQDPYMFDRKFFKISPDEADHLDPQVRLLLEVTWEALEDAGIPASSVRGSQTGVYMGVTASEYAILASMPSHNMNRYTNSGTNSCMMSNRVSYEFDFRGPSFSIDTACSSSLYAIQMACDGLKSGSCEMAVAGGVNLVLMAGATVGFCQAGMLSSDGRSKSFDDSANGYARSEGAGVIVLKLMSKAIEDGDRIYAVIRGGALSNDGRTNGIATPSLDAQKNLIKSACRNAGIDPRDVVYAEAHGTGTIVGDRTEANALGQVICGIRKGDVESPPELGDSVKSNVIHAEDDKYHIDDASDALKNQGVHQGDAKSPHLFIGSVKSNIGHTEGAAGVAGIIKTALSIQRRCIPSVVHFNTPNKMINVEELNICFPKTSTPWPKERPLVATCSSFGFGGANANLVLTGPSDDGSSSDATCDYWKAKPLLLSAASKEALVQRLKDWELFLQNIAKKDEKTFISVLYMAAQRSHHHQHRLGIIVSSLEDAIQQVKLRLAEDKTASCMEDVISSNQPNNKIVCVFSGMGTQWWGMARDLMQSSEVFASKIQDIDEILHKYGAKWSLVNMLTEEHDKEKINKTDIAQPCICAVQIGLLAVWKQKGVVPDVVVGHSVGEVAAAYAAGLLELESAVELVYHRGKLLSKTSGSGKMLAVLHAVDEIQERFQQCSCVDVLDIAAENSPNQIVFSGCNSDIDHFADYLKRDRIKCVRLKVDNAFHSRQQDSIKESFIEKVSKIKDLENAGKTSPRSTIPMMSSVTCKYVTTQEVGTSEYWWSNTRNKVRFKEAIEELISDGCGVFVEVGAHAALRVAIEDTAENMKKKSPRKIITTASLLRPQDTKTIPNDTKDLLRSHVKLHVAGVSSTFESYFEESCRNVTSIPLYPWQREKCSAVSETALELFQFPANNHPLLGERQLSFIAQTAMEKVWKSELNESMLPWLKDHVIGGAVILPAAAYLEVALAVAKEEFPDDQQVTLSNVDLQKFLFASNNKAILETTLDEVQGKLMRVTIRSHDGEATKWMQHGCINISIPQFVESDSRPQFLDVGNVLERCKFPIGGEEFYANESSVGLSLGPSFRSTTKAFVNSEYTEIICYCEAPENVSWDAYQYSFHPAFLDSCFQPFAVLLFAQGREAAANLGTLHRPLKRVPRFINKFYLNRNAPRNVIVHLISTGGNGDDRSCDVKVADAETGELFCVIDGMKFEVFESEGISMDPHIWKTDWVHVPLKGESVDDVETSASDEPDDEDNHSVCIESDIDILDRKFLVFPDQGGASQMVTTALTTLGIHIEVVGIEENPKEAIDQHFASGGSSFTDIIVFRTLDIKGIADVGDASVPLSLEDFQRIENPAPLFCIGILQRVLEIEQDCRPRVVFVTKGAYDVDIPECQQNGYSEGAATRCHDVTNGQPIYDTPTRTTVYENSNRTSIWPYGMPNGTPLYENVSRTTLDGKPNGAPGIEESNQPHAATHPLEFEHGQQITEPINTSTSEPGTSGVFPDPFLSSIHSILITAVHEEPSLRSLILDLPLGSSIQDTAQILHTVLLHLPPDENILSCRYVQPDYTVINEWKLFSPRLRCQSTSKVKVQTSNDQWKVCYDEATGYGKLNMSNSLLDVPKKDNDDVCIRVTAFRSFPPLDQFQTQIVIIYAGVVENSMNANNNQSQERPQRPTRESCVIGITQCSEIPSRLVVKRNLITSIPEGLSCAQAVSLVSRFLPAKVVFDDVFYISTSTNILFLGNNSRMCQSALTILAGMKGVKIVVLLSSTEDDHTPVDGVTYVMSEHIDDLTDMSFDYMIISELTSTLPPGAMLLLLRKLKRRGTVISLQDDNAIASSKYLHNLPSRIKFMSLDMSFPLALEGFSSLEMNALMDEFWKTLTPSVIESSTDDDIKLVSSLPLTNGILPDDAVVDMEGNFTLPFNLQSDTWLADDNVSYLVTGGTRGLGLALVEWLASRKAKHIFVMSRSAPYFEAEETFSRLALQGVNIAHLQGDVTDADLLEELLSNIQNSATKPHLGGIFHFATTYDDGFIHGMTDTSWNGPMSVKAYGTLLLHQMTLKLGITLKYFVVASSVVSVFGNAGQANYCAANNFVNGLCRMRNSMGLPATSLIIGYLNTVGFAVRRGLITAAEENGFISVSPTDVLGALSVALKNNTPEMIIAGPLSMGLFASRHRALMTEHFRQTQGTISLLKTLYNDKEAVMGHSNGSLRQLILDLPIEEARKVILTALSNILSKQLGVESDLQDDSSPVLFGVDSMIASSLSQAVSEQFEVTLGAVDFLNESNTLQSISNKILQKILRSVDEDPDPDPDPDPESLSVQVEEISTNVPSNDIAVPEVTSTSRRIVEGPPLQSPILRIVCFPPNGGGPSTFAAWPHYLTHFGIQLLFVQMPGWEGRDNEIPLATLEEMTQCLTNVLLQVLGDTPFVFFGHSMGSLLAFEVTQSLLQHGYCPQHMFLSSWYAPTEDYPQPEELDVPGPVFQKLGQMLGINITKFQQIMEQENVFFSFIDDVVLNNRALMERMLPAVEVAMKIAKAYHLSREELLPCGITVFGGDNDPFVKPELLEDWRLQIEDETNFDMFLFPGKHMYILDNTDAVLQKITQVLLEQGIALRMPQDGRFGGSLRMTADGGYQEGESDKQPVRLRERKGRATARAPAPVYESSCQTVHKEDEEVNHVAFQTVHKEGDDVNPVVFQTVATVHQEDEDVNPVALIEEDWEELL
ncbi:mycocerosic acid synthase-like [Amphiura filiformis]|uniref:mycocerosic acid synthase-like n=1 Tax=Amphiura filiformis TaxID=82378 RepID=UPI003B21E740